MGRLAVTLSLALLAGTALLAGGALPATAALTAEGGAPPASAPAARQVAIRVTDVGFEPREIKVKRGQPVTLAFTRVTDRTCITAIDIPDEGVKNFELPLNKTVALTITPTKKGVEKFHCSAMGMGNGRLVVDE